MQVLTVLVFTMAALSLLSQAVKASPVLPNGDDESSIEDIRALAVEKDKEFKRICGIDLKSCDRVKSISSAFLLFVLVLIISHNSSHRDFEHVLLLR